jgi:hypothetical protein
MVVVALLLGLYVQQRRQAGLLTALAQYRHPVTEGIFDVLDEPMALTYQDGAPLDVVLKLIKKTSTGRPKLKTGIPIYVDPVGLQEAEKSLVAPVKRPPGAENLPLGEHLQRILEPLGLGYSVKDGFLMIESAESLDEPFGEEADLYLQYRDVLR